MKTWLNYTVMNTLGMVLIYMAWVEGWIQRLIEGDTTYIVLIIGSIFLISVITTPFTRSIIEWVCDKGIPVLLGLLGTVIGVWHAIAGLSAQAEVIKLVASLEISLTTTIAGIVTYLYLLALERLTRHESG